MGCTVSKKTSGGGSGSEPALPFTDTTVDQDEDEDHNSRREIDLAAIEEQSHLKGEQSLLALAMNAKPERELRTKNAPGRLVSEASPRECATLDAATDVGLLPSQVPASGAVLNPIMSPIKIRIQEPHSSAITTEEHEHSKLLPDIKYSMRAAPSATGGTQHQQPAENMAGPFGPLGQLGVAAVNHQPFNGARKLQPITATATASAPNPQRGVQQQMPVLGMVPPDRMLGVARGTVGRGGGFAGSISPLYRGPVQVVGPVIHTGTVGRGGVIAGGPRGVPRPLQAMAARSGGSQRTFRQAGAGPAAAATRNEHASPRAANKSTGKGSSHTSDVDDVDDDDDEFVADDDEVGDWDLDGDDTVDVEPKTNALQRSDSPNKMVMALNTSSHPAAEGSTLFKKQMPGPIQTSHSPAASPQKAPAKFRPTHEMTNDLGDIGIAADSQLVVDDDDDDDSNFGDENEDVGDWFDGDSVADSSVAPTPVRVKKALPSAHEHKTDANMLKSVPGSPAMHPAPSVSPAMTPTAFRHAPSDALKPSPHPPPMQRLPSRQLVVSSGNTSPVKNSAAAAGIGSPTVGSPIKQVSYRSSVVAVGQPVLQPMTLGAPTGSGTVALNAPIRDTKVVKKKRAELPQRNLPHPTPKFGDWLNSRTMINNYIILEALGSGSYAEVKLCKEKVSGKLYAMKFINRDIMKKDKLGKQSKLDDIKREIAIMKKLNHPNVLRLYEVMDDPNMNKLFLVLEYMKHGDLLSHQKKKHAASSSSSSGASTSGEGNAMESLHDRDLHCVFLQVVLGLAYLHEQKIVHGDIKPQNILVGDKDAVKIADFGISQSLYGSKQKLTDTAGTPAFMSPEMCSGEEYSGQMADIWAVGATFFMLKFGNPPFVAKSAMQMFEKIQNDPLVFPFAIDPLLQDLLTGMMVKDPQKRMTLLEVMCHPWVTKEETLSNYSNPTGGGGQAAVPRITVSSDEIEQAIHSKDQFAIIVNIRIQMMKKLQRARQEILERQRLLVHEAHTEGGFAGSVSSGAPVAAAPSHDEQKKSGKLKSPKLKQSNKVHADHHQHPSNEVTSAAGHHKEGEHHMLSNEEIHYRAQLFSRKKTGSTAAPNAGGGSGGKPRDQGDCGFETDADSGGSGSGDTNDSDEDDDDALSSDDDETAVAQSPQLLDELLLTTLSMPPLTKTKSVEAEPRKQDSANSDHHTSEDLQREEAGIQASRLAASTTSDKEEYCGESSTLALQFGVASLQGRRSTQEDRWVVLPQIKGDVAPKWSTSTFVGLFDGHGGEECSNILHEQLHSWIFRDPHDLTLTPAILQTRFEELDTYVCDYLLQKGDLSGSTATCVILSPSDGVDGKIRAIVAHVGDCRLVLSFRNNEVRDVTEDHRLTMSSERDRILALGGRVVNNRVNGVMAITRAFGDLEFKGLLGRKSGALSPSTSSSSSMALIPATVQQNPFQKEEEKIPALLTARPDIHTVELDPRVHEFLLLACDGLWDVLTSEEAAEIFRDRLRFHGNVQIAAKELAQEAIRRYSNDNITVVAIWLGSS